MQVVVGTLESLGKNGGSAPAAFPAASGGADAARIDGLETQVRALTAELQQLSDQVRSLGGNPRRGDIPFKYEHGGDGARPGFSGWIMAEAPAAGLVRRRYRRAAVAMPSADC